MNVAFSDETTFGVLSRARPTFCEARGRGPDHPRRHESADPRPDLAGAWRKRIAGEYVQEDGRQCDERVRQEHDGHAKMRIRVPDGCEKDQ